MWYLQRKNTRAIGPVPTDEVIDGIKSGEIPADTMVCAVDAKQWLPLDAVPELAPFLRPSARDTSPSPVEEAPERAQKPRPRIVRRIDHMPPPRHARAALAVAGAALALFAMAVLVVFAPSASLHALLDAVHPLRSALVVAGAFGSVAWLLGCVASFRLESGRREARSAARAVTLPLLAAIASIAVGLVTAGHALAAHADVSRARTILVSLLCAVTVAAAAWAVLIGRALFDGIEVRRDVLVSGAVAALALVAAPVLREAAARNDVVTVEGPLFADESTLRRHIEALRAGASGVPALDETLAVAVFAPPRTRVRYLDEAIVEAHAGAFVARRVLILEGPRAGTAAFVARR